MDISIYEGAFGRKYVHGVWGVYLGTQVLYEFNDNTEKFTKMDLSFISDKSELKLLASMKISVSKDELGAFVSLHNNPQGKNSLEKLMAALKSNI